MVGLGSVPGTDAGMGCLCRLCRWSNDDKEPGTGLENKGGRGGSEQIWEKILSQTIIVHIGA